MLRIEHKSFKHLSFDLFQSNQRIDVLVYEGKNVIIFKVDLFIDVVNFIMGGYSNKCTSNGCRRQKKTDSLERFSMAVKVIEILKRNIKSSSWSHEDGSNSRHVFKYRLGRWWKVSVRTSRKFHSMLDNIKSSEFTDTSKAKVLAFMFPLSSSITIRISPSNNSLRTTTVV